MAQQFAYWLITGIITALLGVVWYAFTQWRKSINDGISQVNEKLDELIKTIKDLGEVSIENREQISNLTKITDTHEQRLNDHSKRIRDVELKCASNHK